MLSSGRLQFIQCVVHHSCSEDENENEDDENEQEPCAFCQIDYQFIANKPTLLECDHHICEECNVKADDGIIYCKLWESYTKCLNKINRFADMTINDHLNELVEKLANKFKCSIELLKGENRALKVWCVLLKCPLWTIEEKEQMAENCMMEKKLELKNAIDLRVEVLKRQIEQLKCSEDISSYCTD